jgi:signal transduction histidine kinase
MSLRARMLGLFVGLGVLPLLALGAISYQQSMDAVEDLLAIETATVVHRTARELEGRYARYQSDLILLAENLETLSLVRSHYDDGAGSWERVFATTDSYLRQVWEQFRTSYRWIELRDTTGAVVYGLGETRADRPSRAEISGPDLEEGLRFSHPIQDPETSVHLGEVVGVAPIDQVLPPDALSQTFGRAGYSVVLDFQGDRVFYHPQRAQLQARASSLIGRDGWRVAPERLAQDDGSFVFRVGDSARVASFVTMETPSWTVLATSSVDEFSGPFTRMRRLHLVLVALVTAAVLLAFFLMTGRATRSLESLTRAADAVAAGDYSPSLPPTGGDEVGRLSAAFGVMVNRVDETLRRIQESRHMAVIGQFASRLSHEIRNPLTSVKLNLQRIERHAERGGLPDECLGPLEISLGEVDRLDRVVRSVLSLARTGVPGTEPCSVHAVVHRAMAAVGPQLEGQGIEMEEDLRATRDRIVGDEEALQGVFVNLFLNGAEAMPGGGRIRVSSVETSGPAEGAGSIWIKVEDQGSGVGPELAHKIFEPFFSTKNEGTGFGLSVALNTVEDHGGTLRLDEALEGEIGAVFVVELPLASGEQGVKSG